MKSLGGVLAICASIVLSMSIGAGAFLQRNDGARNIGVTGSTRVEFDSDLIVWSGSFTRRAMEIQTAFTLLEKDRTAIRDYLTAKGIQPELQVFSSIDIRKEYDEAWENGRRVRNQFTGYVLSQSVTIESKDVDRVETVSREVTELIKSGIEFISNEPRYYYTRLAELKIQMITAATEDGKQRAERIAASAGSRLAKLKSASLGVFQITAPNSDEEMSWAGAFNTSSKRKTGLVTVRLQFGVK
jgi:hypothetical protein